MVTATETTPAGMATIPQQDGRRLWVATDIGEELLAAFYLQMLHDGLLSTVFYTKVPPITEFIGWLYRSNSRFLGAFVRSNEKGGAESNQSNRPDAAHTEHANLAGGIAGRAQDGSVEMAGLGWLFNIGGCPGGIKCDVGFVYLRKWHRTKVPYFATQMMMDYAFNNVGVDILYGGIASFNKPALRFSQRLGFQHTPVLPKWAIRDGRPCDVVVAYYQKEHFRL